MPRPTILPFLAVVFCARSLSAATPCPDLAKLALPDTTIEHAESVAAGQFTPPEGKALANVPAFCRVSGVIKPSADSDIQFEVWMPQSGWNGKLAGVGNGGFAGIISYSAMGAAVAKGYAASSTDTGHHAMGTDASWAFQHPEKIADFGYRAIHLTAVNARSAVLAFYGEAPKHAYFDSCSNGGRQALMEAERYPEDYDGIIAGAPAAYWTHLLANSVWDLQALLNDKDSYIPTRKLKAIQSAALDACDALDGSKDGVIADPLRCHFDPAVLTCKGPDEDSCLTPPQVTALRKLYAGGRLSNGTQIFPGYSPGGEAQPGAWGLWIVGPAPERSLMFAFGTQFFKNMVFNDKAWDYHTFNADRDTKIADEKMAATLNSNDPDLTRFRKRGGKLILYHGWSDAAIAPRATIDYYESVRAKMGAKQTDGFVRLFMVPGMQHCGGGSQFDMAPALETWVEKGVAPEQIQATKPDRVLKPFQAAN